MNEAFVTIFCISTLLIGLIALILLPTRLWTIFQIFKASKRLSALDLILAILSVLLLIPTLLLWLLVVLSLVAWISAPHGNFGFSEVGMGTTLFGLVYAAFEAVLLIPRRSLRKLKSTGNVENTEEIA